MIFSENMCVVLTKGRFAGKKAVVLKVTDNHLIVGGVERMPSQVKETMSAAEKIKAERFKTFTKKINFRHVLATRYFGEVDAETVLSNANIADPADKKEVNVKVNQTLLALKEKEKKHFLFSELEIKA